MNEKTISLVDHEWIFVTDALALWIEHVKTLDPDHMNPDDCADLKNDGMRLRVILDALKAQL